MEVFEFEAVKMLKFFIFTLLFCFVPWFQVTHCEEIELDTELLEFLSRFPFNLGQVFAEFNKNETDYQTKVFYGSKCFIDLQRIYLGMAARKLWAFKGKNNKIKTECVF